jgi:hypothetical protein
MQQHEHATSKSRSGSSVIAAKAEAAGSGLPSHRRGWRHHLDHAPKLPRVAHSVIGWPALIQARTIVRAALTTLSRLLRASPSGSFIKDRVAGISQLASRLIVMQRRAMSPTGPTLFPLDSTSVRVCGLNTETMLREAVRRSVELRLTATDDQQSIQGRDARSEEFAQAEVVPRARRLLFSNAGKRRIQAATDRCTLPGEIGVLLRREGVYSSSLATEAGEGLRHGPRLLLGHHHNGAAVRTGIAFGAGSAGVSRVAGIPLDAGSAGSAGISGIALIALWPHRPCACAQSEQRQQKQWCRYIFHIEFSLVGRSPRKRVNPATSIEH